MRFQTQKEEKREEKANGKIRQKRGMMCSLSLTTLVYARRQHNAFKMYSQQKTKSKSAIENVASYISNPLLSYDIEKRENSHHNESQKIPMSLIGMIRTALYWLVMRLTCKSIILPSLFCLLPPLSPRSSSLDRLGVAYFGDSTADGVLVMKRSRLIHIIN